MPCTDVTDYVKLELDDSGHLRSFELRKLSCGRTVGGPLLLEYVDGQKADILLSHPLQDFVREADTLPDLENFFIHKQFYALQSALSSVTGKEAYYQTAPFDLEAIEQHDQKLQVSGFLSLDHVRVEEIKACGNCCSKKKGTALP